MDERKQELTSYFGRGGVAKYCKNGMGVVRGMWGQGICVKGQGNQVTAGNTEPKKGSRNEGLCRGILGRRARVRMAEKWKGCRGGGLETLIE